DVIVDYGNGQQFKITPDAGYEVADVLVDKVSVGAVTSYEFTSVTANHTISASFAGIDVVFYTKGELHSGTYHDVTLLVCDAFVTMTGNITITGTLTISDCANLYTSDSIVAGPGSFVLESGGWLHITDPKGITTAACGTGSTCGSIRTATRS